MLPLFSLRLTGLSRQLKQIILILSDFVLLVFVAWASYALRMGTFFVPNLQQFLLILVTPFLAFPVFVKSGLYRAVIRYIGEYALWTVVRAMSLVAVSWSFLAFLTEMTGHAGMPRSVPLLFWTLGIMAVGGSRFFARWLLTHHPQKNIRGRHVLVYGSGGAGRQLVASLREGSELFPIGFLDDEKRLHGQDVAGVRVYGPESLPDLIEHFNVKDVIVTLPSASQARRREVLAFLKQYAPLRVRILPAMSDIAKGRHLVNMVREVDISDLLGRDSVAPDPNLLGYRVTGKNVLISGAGGSIGSDLCRQIVALAPASLIMLETSEHALYQIERQVRSVFDGKIVPCLGSVADDRLVRDILKRYEIHSIYHAAAYKHVPLVEENVLEGVNNNVLGTLCLTKAAFDLGVKSFLLISTDKAVRPTNVMGATKRLAELIVQNFARQAEERHTEQRFSSVRFGNVLGSSGSVIPLFKEQIAQGGPVTVTHKDVIRYFMSIHEAVQLVLQASSMSHGGEVFLLDMGEPVKIIDLAYNMIRLAGYQVKDDQNPDGDIEISMTGLRPGEKLYEELLIAHKAAEKTTHPKIMRAYEPRLSGDNLDEIILRLRKFVEDNQPEQARSLLMRIATHNFEEDKKENGTDNVISLQEIQKSRGLTAL